MKVKLGNYIKEYSVRNKSNEGIPVYSVTNTQGFCRDYFGKEVASKDRTTYKIVPKGCFAYNPSRINVGSVDWQRNEERVIVSPLYNVFSVSPEINQQYLYYYLKSDRTLYYIKAIAEGSVRDNLKLSMLYEFSIELRPVEEQVLIAQRLDLVQKIIRLRKQELDTYDNLIKARFVELFGDLMENPFEWPVKTIADISLFLKSGLSRKLSDDDIGLPVIRSANIQDGQFIFDDIKYWYIDDPQGAKTKDYVLDDGDILVNFINSASQIGKTAIYRDTGRDCIYTTNIFRMKLADNCNEYYYDWYAMSEYYYRHLQSIIQPAVNQASFTTVNFLKLPIPLPPIDKQNEFAEFVKQVDKSKVAVQKALDETQCLFDSLMQKYFG